MGGNEQTVYTTCSSHCGGTCPLKVQVKDGVITRIEADDYEEPQFRACLKGRAYRQRVYAPDRLLYPLKRVGPKGEGKFERVAWDQALDTIAAELRRIRDTYGPGSLFYLCSGGDPALLHFKNPLLRVLNLAGGCTEGWGTCSFEGGSYASSVQYGTLMTANSRDDLLNSRLIIMWGWDPATTRQNTGTDWYLAQARERGIRIISVDPRYSATSATLADEWIPVKPGTDAAVLIAMAYVIIAENLQDQRFLDRYTVGFERYRAYVVGDEDGVPKTPGWAESISGMPASTIVRLAREYATAKPAVLIAGIGPGRTAYGEQYHRTAMTLAAMTGNIGIHGGDAAGITLGSARFDRLGPGIEAGSNPVSRGAPPRRNTVQTRGGGWWSGADQNSSARIRSIQLPDVILRGKAGGYPSDIKAVYLVNTNFLNQYTNANQCAEAFRKLEFLVVHEQFMTPTAKFADIVLPVCTFLERNDIAMGGATPFYGRQNKVIDSLGESKSHLEIGQALAAKMGLADYGDKTEEEWLRGMVAGASFLPDYETFAKQGVFKVKRPEPYVAFHDEIRDPDHHPFPTPSGKIEIYSQQLADMNDPSLPPIPKYIETWESLNDPLAKKYPLQLVTTHLNRRAHSQFDNIPWARETHTQAIMINPVDASARGVAHGDEVKVFNDRGEMVIPAWVTERIMPGVVDVPQGAWYDPDEQGIDRGGCANVLIQAKPSPGGAYPTNTALVEVAKT